MSDEVQSGSEAPQGQPAESSSTDAPVTSGKTTPGSEPSKAGQATTSFDPQKSYSELVESHKKLQRSYDELRPTYTKSQMELGDVKKQLAGMADLLAKLTEEPVDPQKFMQDLQTHGPKAMEAYLNKAVKQALKEYDKKIEDFKAEGTKAQHENRQLKFDKAASSRKSDAHNYPDWEQLVPTMNELASDPKTPINFNGDPEEILDQLYQIAKSKHGGDAIKAAEVAAAKKKEEELRNEAGTTVPGGGRSGAGSVPDLESMPLDQLEKLAIAKHGIADRD